MNRAGRLTIVQYAGDFREASQRLTGGGIETYRGQRYTVGHVEALAGRCDEVTTITGFTDHAYDVILPSGARAIGAGFRDRFDGRAIAALVAKTAPDRLILRTPSRPVMRWAVRHRCRTLMLLADSFDETALRGRLGRALLALHLKLPMFEIVANHGVRAARQLAAAGVPARKVIAWDYPAFDTPFDRPAKSAAGTPLRILYVGMLVAEKGVDDLIAALALLAKQGLAARLDLIGKGDDERLRALVTAAGLGDTVRFAGLVPNAEIIPAMAAADVVVVPSRHDYPEGLPLTIYEALCSRTPLVASDHPMFVENVVDGESGLIFRAGDAAALAGRLARLAEEPDTYAALSRAGAAAWQRLQIPVKWGELIDRWLDDDRESRAWLARHAIGRG